MLAVPDDAPSVLMLEIATLVDLPIGELMLKCLRSKQGPAGSTFDIYAADRMALVELANGHALGLLAGTFTRPLTSESEHEAAAAPVRAPENQFDLGASSAEWNAELRVYGERDDDVRGAVHRVEHPVSAANGMDVSDTYGEIRGKLSSRLIAKLLPAPLSELIESSGLTFDLHVDAGEDLLISAETSGDRAAMHEVGKALTTALEGMRQRAAVTGQVLLQRLLEGTSLHADELSLKFEAVIPVAVVEELSRRCADDRPRAPHAAEDD